MARRLRRGLARLLMAIARRIGGDVAVVDAAQFGGHCATCGSTLRGYVKADRRRTGADKPIAHLAAWPCETCLTQAELRGRTYARCTAHPTPAPTPADKPTKKRKAGKRRARRGRKS